MLSIIQAGSAGMKKPELPAELIYPIYRRDKRKVDLSNVCAIVDKFVADGLVLAGILPGDNVKFVRKTTYIGGGIDRDNPRACLEIKHYEGK